MSFYKVLKSYYLYFLMLCFVFISSFAMKVSQNIALEEVPKASILVKAFSDVPVLSDDYSPYPVLSAQSAIAVDLTSGVYLYEKDPEKPLLPASTTKIVTALVVMDTFNIDDVLTVSDVSVVGQKMGLVVGEKISVLDLLYGLLVYSANDAAEALAQNHPEGRDVFIKKMNEKATDMGLRNSNFSNPAGLDSADQYSTAKDLITVSKAAMKNPLFAKIVGTEEITVRSVDNRYIHKLKNINELLGKVEGVMGVKTGWTEIARENLVTYIKRDGREVVTVVLGSQDRFGETEELLSWVFDNYEWEKVSITYSP